MQFLSVIECVCRTVVKRRDWTGEKGTSALVVNLQAFLCYREISQRTIHLVPNNVYSSVVQYLVHQTSCRTHRAG